MTQHTILLGSRPPTHFGEAARELRFRLVPPLRLWALMHDYARHRDAWFNRPITHPDVARLAVVRAKEFAGTLPESTPPRARPHAQRGSVEWDILLDQLSAHGEKHPQARDDCVDPALKLADEALGDVREFLERHARLIVVLSDGEVRRKLLWLRVRKMMVGKVRGTKQGTTAPSSQPKLTLLHQLHLEKGAVDTLSQALQIAADVGDEEVQRIVDEASL